MMVQKNRFGLYTFLGNANAKVLSRLDINKYYITSYCFFFQCQEFYFFSILHYISVTRHNLYFNPVYWKLHFYATKVQPWLCFCSYQYSHKSRCCTARSTIVAENQMCCCRSDIRTDRTYVKCHRICNLFTLIVNIQWLC